MSSSSGGRRFPNESVDYRAARNELLDAEADLRASIERVAAQRCRLPVGGAVPEDYRFHRSVDGDEVAVQLSDLFGDHSTLFIYSFMFSPSMDAACPSCTSVLDALDGQIPDIERRTATAIVARHEPAVLEKFAANRRWRNHTLVSSKDNSFNRDYHAETDDGHQMTIAHVFTLDGDTVHHRWSSELVYAPFIEGGESRHVDLFWPLWGVLDLTPDGRGDFAPALRYGD